MDTQGTVLFIALSLCGMAFAAFVGYARGHCKGWLVGYDFRESMMKPRDSKGRYARAKCNTDKLPLA
jgi:hypothetical protein